ncbi:MAG: PfkB family carbohydrate kinase [Planctomycetota bacterium]|jgi:sugar/nucleoside kinase (ribokinase family)
MALLVVGSVGLDRVETPYGSTEDELGGSAIYFSFAASHFSPVRLVAVVGDDFPPAYLDRLAARPIDLQGLRHVAGSTFRWHGAYEGRMEQARTVDVQMNVLDEVEPDVPADYADSRYVFLANAPPAAQMRVLRQIQSPTFVMADTMNYYIENERAGLLELIEQVDGLIVNDGEALQLSGRSNLLAAARWICDHGPAYCIVKKGEHGALLWGSEGTFVLPGYPHENVMDPTGAGDSFAGGLMGYLASRDDLGLDAMKFGLAYGTVTASFAIEHFGLKGLEGLTAEAIEARLGEFISSTHLRPL